MTKRRGGGSSWRTTDRRKRRIAISDYGLIGDQRTCALVALDGSIDWLCFPRFDSPSVFGAILDQRRGGRFSIQPATATFESRQHYERMTNILVTEFRTDSGRAKLTDFMPCFEVGPVKISAGEVHRRLLCEEGTMRVRMDVAPRPGYGSLVPRLEEIPGMGYSFLRPREQTPAALPPGRDTSQELALLTSLKFRKSKGRISRSIDLKKGERVDLVLRYGGLKAHHSRQTNSDIKLEETRTYWSEWAKRIKYEGKWKDMVLRSALTLRLMFYSPTGAIVAAPTTSLPEKIGGVRNWDYRFSWIRDSSFVLWALNSIGIIEAEEHYLRWLTSIFYLTGGDLQVMLGINGERDLTERTLPNLRGFRGSSPVRIGNAAWTQFQLDVYGILVDALWFSHRHMGGISGKVYEYLLRPIVEAVGRHWKEPDSGIWEVRSEREHFVYSKVWCWVALDRAVRIAAELGMVEDREEWTGLREEVKRSILERGWNESVGSFVRSYGSSQLDAANLLMPQLKFIDASDPKMRATLDKTMRTLMTGKKFVYRYLSEDGLPGEEGAFLICSFWVVTCLTLEGRLGEAERMLDSLVECSNHLGLFSEEIDPKTGTMLGNFPQAFAHMGFITATVGLTEALAERDGPRSAGRRQKSLRS